jgi:hypothetical protein
MAPQNKICPTCGLAIERLRNVPVFAGKRYCSSDCTIDAWQASKAKAASREIAARLAAETFGTGTRE